MEKKKINPNDNFKNENRKNIEKLANDIELKNLAIEYIRRSDYYNYSFFFEWLGRPIIQRPEDIIAMQEIIWNIKPDLIIETGIAHGGSLIYYASLLELLGSNGKVLGIDIEIRPNNRKAIEEHPMFKRIIMIEGSSISDNVIQEVKKNCKSKKKILVCLDSNHTYKHVLKELELYSEFVSIGSYLVVFDTIIDYLPEDHYGAKPYKKGNSPNTALLEFLKKKDNFIIDKNISNKLIITVAPNGYLKRIK